LVGYSGTGATSFTSVNIPAGQTYSGQTVGFNGQPALTIAADSSNPPSGIIVQNTSGNTLAVFRFTETSNVENVKVTQLNVLDKVATSSIKAAFSNVSLWNGSTLLGTAASPVWDGNNVGWMYNFNSFVNQLTVPQGNSVSLTLKGDAGSYTNGSLTDNTTSTFQVVSTGAGSNYVAMVPATSVLTVSTPAVLATSTTYSMQSTANGVTTAYATLTLTSSTANGQDAEIATQIAAQMRGASSTLGITNAVASGATVTITSAGYVKPVASASVFTLGTVTTASETAGTAASGVASTQNVIARGATSNKTATVSLSAATGNAQTTLRTLLGAAATPVSSLPPASFSQLGSLTFTANSAGDAELNNLSLTWSGSVNVPFLNTVVLHDPSGNDIVGVDNFATYSTSTASTSAWTFATSTKPLTITAGTSYTVTIWGDLSQIPTVTSQGLSLTATIKNANDFGYLDGSNGTPALIHLTSSQANTLTPVNLQSGSGLPL
jgi:hypothetical protein